MPKPKKSKARSFLGVLGISAVRMKSASAPTGRFTRNTARQSNVSVSQPPRVGPMIGPTMMPAPKMAMAWPSFSRGLMSIIVAWASGASTAPQMPCATRNSTISSRLVAMPQSSEAPVKPITANSSRLRRPMKSANQPVSGVAMAAATI